MAYAIDTETLVDTATTTVLHSTGRATDATDVDATIFDASACLLYTSPSPRDVEESRMPSSA